MLHRAGLHGAQAVEEEEAVAVVVVQAAVGVQAAAVVVGRLRVGHLRQVVPEVYVSMSRASSMMSRGASGAEQPQEQERLPWRRRRRFPAEAIAGTNAVTNAVATAHATPGGEARSSRSSFLGTSRTPTPPPRRTRTPTPRERALAKKAQEQQERQERRLRASASLPKIIGVGTNVMNAANQFQTRQQRAAARSVVHEAESGGSYSGAAIGSELDDLEALLDQAIESMTFKAGR